MSDSGEYILATVPVDPIIHLGLAPDYPIITAQDDNRATLIHMMGRAVGLISRGLAPIDSEIIEAGKSLRFISRTGAGYENLDIAAATARGLPVIYAPLLAVAAAEATMALILGLSKRLLYWHGALIDGAWDRRATERTDELFEKTIGIVGLGRIGRAVAERARAFGMNVLGHDPYVTQDSLNSLSVSLVSLDTLLESSDVVSLHVMVTDETTAMIDRAALSKMKRGAYLVNLARGAVVENLDILYDALAEGRLAGVGLDVFPDEPPTDLKHPIFHHPNFIGSPHVLASTAASETRCSHSVVRDILAVLSGQRPNWCVNPEVFTK